MGNCVVSGATRYYCSVTSLRCSCLLGFPSLPPSPCTSCGHGHRPPQPRRCALPWWGGRTRGRTGVTVAAAREGSHARRGRRLKPRGKFWISCFCPMGFGNCFLRVPSIYDRICEMRALSQYDLPHKTEDNAEHRRARDYLKQYSYLARRRLVITTQISPDYHLPCVFTLRSFFFCTNKLGILRKTVPVKHVGGIWV